MIENTQRDLNIALINELTLIFERMGIDTEEVLRAAQERSGTSSRSGPDSSAATVSASTRIT